MYCPWTVAPFAGKFLYSNMICLFPRLRFRRLTSGCCCMQCTALLFVARHASSRDSLLGDAAGALRGHRNEQGRGQGLSDGRN